MEDGNARTEPNSGSTTSYHGSEARDIKELGDFQLLIWLLPGSHGSNWKVRMGKK